MLSEYAVRVLLGGIVSVGLVLFVASTIHHRYHFTKKAFFTVLSGVIVSVTMALAAINFRLIQTSENSSISRREGYLNIIACDQQIRILPENELLLQSAGDASHQVYPNGRLQYLGYRTDERLDGSLGGFFQSIGGAITSSVVAIPLSRPMMEETGSNPTLQKFIKTNPVGEKYLELRSGATCTTSPSMLSIYLYEYSPSIHTYVQKRILRSPEEYLLSQNDFSEPDCIVIVYGEPSERTDKVCSGFPDTKDVIYAEDIE